jgi:hypothetical protein
MPIAYVGMGAGQYTASRKQGKARLKFAGAPVDTEASTRVRDGRGVR